MDEKLRRLLNNAKKDPSLWPEYLEACKRGGRHAWRKCLSQMHYAGASVVPAIYQEFLANLTWRLMRTYCLFRFATRIDQRSVFQTLVEANSILRSFSVDVDNGGQIFVNYESTYSLDGDQIVRANEAEKIVANMLGWDFQRNEMNEEEDEGAASEHFIGYTGIYDSDSDIDEDFVDEPRCKKSSIEAMMHQMRVGINSDRKIICWGRNAENLVSEAELDALFGPKNRNISPGGHLFFISTNIQLDAKGVVQD